MPVADTRTGGETQVYSSLLILQEFNFYTCTCLKVLSSSVRTRKQSGTEVRGPPGGGISPEFVSVSPVIDMMMSCMPGKRVVCWRLQQEDSGSTFNEGQKGTKHVSF